MDSDTDLVDKVRFTVHVREVAVKQRMARSFDSKVRPRNFRVGDLVLKKVIKLKQKEKLAPN